jgi:hypothetical protein
MYADQHLFTNRSTFIVVPRQTRRAGWISLQKKVEDGSTDFMALED